MSNFNRKFQQLIARTGSQFVLALTILIATSCSNHTRPKNQILQFVFTSDSHFGITRPAFRGGSNVYANVVNAAMIKEINTLPQFTLPNDSGVGAGENVGAIDYLINTGDIANRSEEGIQTASVSWKQFVEAYVDGLTTTNHLGKKTEFWLAPGNHDISNAIGHYHIPATQTDNASMVGIYNYMFPNDQKTSANFNFSTDKIHYSKDVAGIHFLFVQLWPDSAERIWINKNLESVSNSTPVVLFEHDQPDVESKHLTNPNGKHDINATDQFENLLGEVFKDGQSVSVPSTREQGELVAFLKAHPNIKVLFHGNEHVSRFYDYTGPDHDIDLKTIQVDSPMKGVISRQDETKVSFQLISLDPDHKLLTVRECFWNTDPAHPEKPIVWGKSTTISL